MRGETSAAESECDRISNLPSDLIRSVIDLLPLKDALRTSILSKQWRYKWATRSQLLLDDQFIDALRRSCSGDNFQFTRAYGVVIHRLLARINGPIHRIVLYVEEFFNPLSNIEELHIQKMLWDHHCSFAVPGRFPVELPRLKRLVLGPIASTVCNVAHAFCFIQGCPNLQELEIVVSSFYEACSHDTPKLDTQCFFECLETVKIQCGLCSENELRLIENLLACTPVLELMTVEFDVQMTSMLQQLRIAKEQLMGFCRASSRAEIVCMP